MSASCTRSWLSSDALGSQSQLSAGVGDLTVYQAEDVEPPLVESQLGKRRKIQTIIQLADQKKSRDSTEFVGLSVGHPAKSTGTEYLFIAEK